jgi:hypothetical protein
MKILKIGQSSPYLTLSFKLCFVALDKIILLTVYVCSKKPKH